MFDLHGGALEVDHTMKSWTTAVVVLVAACVGGDTRSDRVLEERIDATQVVLSADVESVGSIGAMRLGPDGRVWFIDGANQQIARLDVETGEVAHFGQGGDGPGEMQIPDGLAVGPDGVLVYDIGNGRVTRFGLDGTYREIVSTPGALIGPVALNRRGDVLGQTMGYGAGLGALRRVGHEGTDHIGELVAPVTRRSFSQRQAEARQRGSIPAEFRNVVLPVLADDGRSWLVLQVDGEVRAFDANGALLWTTSLPVSAMATAEATYLRRVAESTGRLYSPSTVSDAQFTGDELWIAVPELVPDDSAVVVLDARTGERRAVLRLGDMGYVRVLPDVERQRLYIARPAEGELVVAGLPRW